MKTFENCISVLMTLLYEIKSYTQNYTYNIYVFKLEKFKNKKLRNNLQTFPNFYPTENQYRQSLVQALNY